MGKSIPVLIYHESGTKRINGGGLNQSYVKYCIKQAEKWNEEVVFLGHPCMKDYAKKFVAVQDFDLPKYEEFKKVFVNMSDYKESWTLSTFKAYYVYEAYMKENNIDECIIMDSDTLIYHTFTTDDEYAGYKAALLINNDQSMKDLPFDNDMAWIADGIVGYFTREAMTEFTDYLIDMFRNHQDILEKKWKLHRDYHIDGGICNMTLEYLWCMSEENKDKIYNLSKPDAPLYFDDDAHELRGFKEGKYGLKEIGFTNHLPYVVTADGTKKDTKLLHFVGTTKAHIHDYYYYQKPMFKSFWREFYLNKIFPILLKIRNSIKKK